MAAATLTGTHRRLISAESARWLDAYLNHLEHGYLGIAPGSYLLRRQREHREAVRTVID
jgi:hypothetical protein